MRKLLLNPVFYVLGYIALMVPTYLLPYAGSNSSLLRGMGAVTGVSSTGLVASWPVYAHVFFLALLVVLAAVRSPLAGRSWLWVLPLLAGCFDMLPLLSLIPLIPTVLHLGAVIIGARNGGDR